MLFFQRWILKNSFLNKFAPAMGIRGQIVNVEEGDLWCDCFGDKNNPTLLLLMGGGCQGIIWTEAFCEKLAADGFFVIRFDQRDTGFSSYHKEPYTLLNMARDVTSLLDRLQIKKAHLLGISMGGAITQIIAANFPSYVSSITLIATSGDFRPIAEGLQGRFDEKFSLSYPKKEWLDWAKEAASLPAFAFRKRIKKHIDGWKILNGQKTEFPYKYYMHLLKEGIKRQRSHKALLNHKAAILSSLDILDETKGKIQAPAFIVHGGCDPLFLEDHPKSLASSIPNSKLFMIEEMGHNFCPCFHDLVAKETVSFLHSCSNRS